MILPRFFSPREWGGDVKRDHEDLEIAKRKSTCRYHIYLPTIEPDAYDIS